MRRLIITTLAEYQTRFWVPVAAALQSHGVRPSFISFDDRSTDMIEAGGFAVRSANEVEPVPEAEQAAIFERVGLAGLSFWTSHERFAFGRTDTERMHEKLARSVLAGEMAIEQARSESDDVTMLQEVGGFLSNIGCYHAALAAGLDHWFIEPSFFRGRMMLRRNTFSAPRFEGSDAPASPEVQTYLRETIAKGAIVIPDKDAHQYRAASTKVFNRHNARRLAEKLRDKYLLGKRQEFGFIGEHVGSHLRMIANSKRLASHYTSLAEAGRFIYYPLHVPGDIALTIRSPEYLDQLSLVDYLCRTLPDGYRLALKEHPAKVGALEADRILELLRRYDNLILLDPRTNNYSVLREAECIVTVNSKSGAEAGLLGKKVFVLGDAFYRDAPFAVPVGPLAELPPMLAAGLAESGSSAEPPAHLEWFGAVWRQTLPGDLYIEDEERVGVFARSLMSLWAPAERAAA